MMRPGSDHSRHFHPQPEHCTTSVLRLGSSFGCGRDDSGGPVRDRRRRISSVAILSAGPGGPTEFDIALLQEFFFVECGGMRALDRFHGGQPINARHELPPPDPFHA